MLVSSPSPSLALRPSPSSPSSPSIPLSPCSPFPRRSSTTSATFAYSNQQYEPARDPSAVPSSHFSRRSSRLAIEELRSALTKHSVSHSTSVPSGDLPCGRMSAGQTSLGGGISAPTASAPAAPAANAAIFPETSDRPVNNGLPAVSSAPLHPPPPPTAHVPVSGPAQTPPARPMPARNGSSGSNKRQSPNDTNFRDADPGRLEHEGSQSKRLRPSIPAVKLLPARYELADTRDIVVLISSMIMELIRFNDKIPLHQGRLTRFHSRSPPRISVQDYLQRLTTHATLSPPILLSMVYYIDRLCALYPSFSVSSLTIHRFLIASATVASKGLSDSFWTNKTYARVGGISMPELALLELEFLFRVEWRIVPQPEVLDDYYRSLVERCEGYEILSEH